MEINKVGIEVVADPTCLDAECVFSLTRTRQKFTASLNPAFLNELSAVSIC